MLIKTNSALETQAVAKDLAKTLKSGDVLLLKGELGAGKTTFTQGIADHFGIKEPLTSPTFIGMQLYSIPNNPHADTLCHIDAYRFSSPDDTATSGIDDYLGKPGVVSIIEWPEQISHLPKKHLLINFNHVNENTRTIEFEIKL